MSDWRVRVEFVDGDGDEDHEEVTVYDEPGYAEAAAVAVGQVEAACDIGEVLKVEVLHEW